MEMFVLTTLGIGSALGLRFKVSVLIPAVFVAVTLTTACTLVQGATFGSIVTLNIMGAICLQFGYLGGSVFATLTAAGRFGGAKGLRSVP